MEHLVYLDPKKMELEKLMKGEKTMIIRGGMERETPYGLVNEHDILFFLQKNGKGRVKAKARVVNVINSDKLNKRKARNLIRKNQTKLGLTDEQFSYWENQRYLVLIELTHVSEVEPFAIDDNAIIIRNDWITIEDIGEVKLVFS